MNLIKTTSEKLKLKGNYQINGTNISKTVIEAGFFFFDECLFGCILCDFLISEEMAEFLLEVHNWKLDPKTFISKIIVFIKNLDLDYDTNN